MLIKDKMECGDCVFKAMNGQYQTGCIAHDISDELYTIDTSQSFVFSEKACQYKRTNKKNIDIDKYAKKVREEVRIKYTLFVECDEDAEPLNIISSFLNIKTKPNSFIFICNSKKAMDKISNELKNAPTKSWKAVLNLVPDKLDNITYCLNNFKTHRYVFINSNHDFYPQFIDWLDEQVNDYNFGYSIIGGDVKIFPRSLYDATLLPISEIEAQLCKYTFSDLYSLFCEGRNWKLGEKRFC